MRGLALLLSWLVLLPAAFRQPFIGVLLWEWTAFITPNFYIYGFMADLPFNKIVAAVTAVALLFSGEKKRIHWDLSIVLMMLLLLQGTISFLLAPDNTAAPPIFDRFWKECVLAVLINMTITTRLRLHAMLLISAIALGFHCVDAGLKMIVTGGHFHLPGIGGFGDNNQSAIPLLMAFPVLYYVSQYSLNKLVKYTCFAGMVLDVPAVMSTWSRGAFIGLAVLGIAMVILSKRRMRAIALVGIGAVVMISLLSVGYVDRLETIRTADDDASFMGRVLAWEVSVEIARENPVFGAGFHGVQDGKIWREYVTKVPIPQVLDRYQSVNHPKAAHSIFFEVLGDVGFVGFGLWLSLMLVTFYKLRFVIKATKARPDQQWMMDLAVMLRLSLIVYVTSGAAVSMGWFEMYYVVVMLVAVLARFCREIAAETRAEARLAAGGLRLSPLARPLAVPAAGAGRPL